MRMTNRVLTLLLMLALAVPVVAVPATSFAQSAGDDQYVDPFQDDNSGGGGNQGNSGNSGNSGSNTPSDQQSAQAPANSGDTAGATATDSANKNTLPRTGFPAGPLVVIGVILLLGGGFALRRVWPRPH
jgi:LPXTG-motif cell wall-anchored protein